MMTNTTKVACVLTIIACAAPAMGKGKIKGTTGGNERGAAVYSKEGSLEAWTVTGPSGLYEFGGLEPGEYMMEVTGNLVPRVRVVDGETTIVEQANQPKLTIEKELWGPSRVNFAQSFVATGTAVTGFSLWRSSGRGKLLVSLYEDSPAGKRIAGPYETEKEMVWICWTSVPSEDFQLTPGKTYAFELTAANGEPWNHSMPRTGDVYPDGIAYYDGVPHPESDLGIDIEQEMPGLEVVAAARDDQHFIAEGPGSGSCKVAGQTFIATTPNIIRAGVNCGGFGGGVQDFIFSIHEEGPGGKQVGPAARVRMVTDWGTDAIWFPDAIQVTPGKQYYFQYKLANGGSFYGYLSSDKYKQGRAYRDGKVMPEQFDAYFKIIGEAEPESVIFPYNMRVSHITDTTATVTWRTGTVGDGLVHFGTELYLGEQAGSTESREQDHTVTLTGLKPGTVYLYRVSSHTHKESSRRTYSRIHSFLTLPEGGDEPRFDQVADMTEPASCAAIVNGSFEDELTGWSRMTSTGRKKNPESYNPNADPIGNVTGGIDGYNAFAGTKLYGMSYFGREDPTWVEPREDWNRELLWQRIPVEEGRTYQLTAHILTGDRGSGWGRDSRISIVVDEQDTNPFDDFATLNDCNMSQWFATRHRWLPVKMQFKAKADHVKIGIHFLQWWALETNRLYVDEITVRPID